MENNKPLPDELHNTPPAPSLSGAMAVISAQWQNMLPYADTARIEPLHHAGGWCWGVTVRVIDRSME